MLTASPPELDRDEPWSTSNNQVRLGSGDAELPTGTWTEARLYCGHDTGAPASGCTSHPRAGRDLVYYWCDNDGDVTVSCTCNRGIDYDISASATTDASAGVIASCVLGGFIGLVLLVGLGFLLWKLKVKKQAARSGNPLPGSVGAGVQMASAVAMPVHSANVTEAQGQPWQGSPPVVTAQIFDGSGDSRFATVPANPTAFTPESGHAI